MSDADTVPSKRGVSADMTGRVLLERYRLERKLGRGGMGEVWQARHLGLGTDVAVKMIHAFLASSPDEAKRFAHEAHALSLLSHPNVVRVLDFGRDGETQVLVMELLSGEPLGDRLERAPGLLPLAFVVDVTSQILAALEAVHALGIVHRDLKPDNIYLTEDVRGRMVAKLVDFGLAHVDDPRDEKPLTVTGSLAGTPQYMSPEQCRSLRVGPSADLYSVGCILTELLTGRPPFSAASAVDLITRHLFTPAPPLKRPPGTEDVPPLLEKLRLDLLAKTPERRPASAREVEARLRDAMDPQRAAELLPDRSNAHGEPRSLRASSWPAPRPEEGSAAGVVGIVRTEGEPLLDDATQTALASRGLRCSFGDSAPLDADVSVLDAGSVALAEAWLLARADASPTIVCVRSASVDAISRLIASGAAAVLLAPVGPDTLARKVQSLLRRKHRTS